MHNRQNALNNWLNHVYTDKPFSLTALAGDASFRQYFRVKSKDRSYILMDAPPEKEPISSFIAIDQILQHIGIHAPKIYAADEKNGFLLLEDFGDQQLFTALSSKKTNRLYETAMDTLVKMQQSAIPAPSLPVFDKPYMLTQMQLFQDWFLSKYLALKLNHDEALLIQETFNWLGDEILKQPYVLVHCDYHSRNLMVVSDKKPIDLGIIDFQDAMWGPFSYDLVSLLKDCYISWPKEQRLTWLNYFYTHLPENYSWTFEDFVRGFDLCGIQRHLKVLGIFSRLYIRDNKSNYLKDLPLTIDYLLEGLKDYHELKPFYRLISNKMYPLFNKKQTS